MIEHEISELEDKWQKYKNSKKINKGKSFFTKKKFFTLLFLTLLIGAIVFSIYTENELVKEQKDKIINLVNNFTNKNSDDNIIQVNNAFKNQSIDDDFLSLNDLEVMVSEDGAGFERITRKNEDDKPATIKEIVYMPQAYPMPMQMPMQMPAQQQSPNPSYSPSSEQEVISFQGYPDSPNSKRANQQNKAPNKTPAKLQIQTKQTSGTSTDKLISAFNKSKNPSYALLLSDEFYAQRKYADAEKWALVANDLDKDNAKSWIAFAKAKYKQGDKNTAIEVLRNYNSRMPNDEVSSLIRDMQVGAF